MVLGANTSRQLLDALGPASATTVTDPVNLRTLDGHIRQLIYRPTPHG